MTLEADIAMPDSPEGFQALFEQFSLEGEGTPPPQAAATSVPDPPKAASDIVEPATSVATSSPPVEDVGEGDVATKDGKYTIPYEVLKEARLRATRAEQAFAETNARLAALEAQIAAAKAVGTKPGAVPTNPEDTGSTDGGLESLKDDFPTVYDAIKAATDRYERLEAKLRSVEEHAKSQVAERTRTDTEMVQEAIDSVPTLAHMQATDPEAFELAKQYDATLQKHPAWAGKPLASRFAKVTEMVEATLGPVTPPAPVPAQAPHQSPEALAKAAKAKAEQSTRGGRSAVPTSLSEFPAGNPPAQDERQAVDQMTHHQLAEKFSRMTPDQMDAYFREL